MNRKVTNLGSAIGEARRKLTLYWVAAHRFDDQDPFATALHTHTEVRTTIL